MMELLRLAATLWVFQDAVQVGVLLQGKRVLLIDFGSGEVIQHLHLVGGESVDRILFTHHHRDQAYGLSCLAKRQTRQAPSVLVPEKERQLFEAVEVFWERPTARWHIYDFRPSAFTLTESVKVSEGLQDGDSFRWGEAEIRAVSTPGHTDGHMAYLVETEGKRFCFTGDLLYEGGRLLNLFDLQKGDKEHRDYHGFLGARAELLESLRRVEALEPTVLIPSHGPIIENPAPDISLLRNRVEEAYRLYAETAALRHYFPEVFDGMPPGLLRGKTRKPHGFLRHIGTSWLILSEGHGFLIDCGGTNVIQELERMKKEGDLSSLDLLWITHYHDDHVDGIPALLNRFPCPVYTDSSVASVVTDPLAHRLPCISPAQVDVDHVVKDGESWSWRGFKLSGYTFPGQTLYHAGLLLETKEESLFFAGDSFTPTGMDDYCLQNRHLLGKGRGYQRCLRLLSDLEPDWIFNCHVDVAFHFTQEDYQVMLDNLERRKRLCGSLLPWNRPNFGLDPYWMRVLPYQGKASPGETIDRVLRISWYGSQKGTLACRARLPSSWPSSEKPPWSEAVVKEGKDRDIPFRFSIPDGVPPGRHLLPVEIKVQGLLSLEETNSVLGPLTEFILTVD